jgi:hypothetical protein
VLAEIRRTLIAINPNYPPQIKILEKNYIIILFIPSYIVKLKIRFDKTPYSSTG